MPRMIMTTSTLPRLIQIIAAQEKRVKHVTGRTIAEGVKGLKCFVVQDSRVRCTSKAKL